MTKASLETFLRQVNSLKSKTDKVRVYRYILKNPNCTKNDLIRDLNMPHQTVTARLSDLLDLGVVEITGTQNKVTGCVSLLQIQFDENKIDSNAKERRLKKFKAWQKKGEQFSDLITA